MRVPTCMLPDHRSIGEPPPLSCINIGDWRSCMKDGLIWIPLKYTAHTYVAGSCLSVAADISKRKRSKTNLLAGCLIISPVWTCSRCRTAPPPELYMRGLRETADEVGWLHKGRHRVYTIFEPNAEAQNLLGSYSLHTWLSHIPMLIPRAKLI